MKKIRIVRFGDRGECQFVYFNWKKFKFETSCWAGNINLLFGKNKDKKYFIIGLYNK